MTDNQAFSVLSGKVLVAGAGVSGIGCARLLTGLGVDTTIADDNTDALARAVAETDDRARGIDVAEARGRLMEYSTLVTSPGWRPDSPLLVDAAFANCEVIGDVELAYRLDRAGVFGPPRTWLVVTGTNGKTTTTAMLAAMMAETGKDTGLRAAAVGNIGVAVTDALVESERIDILVAELSSFQLHWSSQLTPDAGVLLNLADDHIDWHGSFFNYVAAKAKVLTAPVAVAGIDDGRVREQLRKVPPANLIGFTLDEPRHGDFGVSHGMLVDNTGADPVALARATGIEPPGPAGVLDALAAAAVARSQGARPEHIAAALRSFSVAGHRGQTVETRGGVRFIDNSKATNPHAADAAMSGLSSVIWVAGGQLKGADITGLVAGHAERIKAAAVLGVDRSQFAKALERHAPHTMLRITDSTDPSGAMDELIDWAVSIAEPGDTVLLAPAAASLDMYTGMAQRGDLFTEAVVRHSDRLERKQETLP